MIWFLIALAVWNIAVFIIYAVDKQRAIKGEWRISEAFLVSVALLMGGVGALAGMFTLRHKTKHSKFLFFVPLGAVITIAAAVLMCIFVF